MSSSKCAAPRRALQSDVIDAGNCLEAPLDPSHQMFDHVVFCPSMCFSVFICDVRIGCANKTAAYYHLENRSIAMALFSYTWDSGFDVMALG